MLLLLLLLNLLYNQNIGLPFHYVKMTAITTYVLEHITIDITHYYWNCS